MNLKKITEGLTGAESSDIIYNNDMANLENTQISVAPLKKIENEYLPIQIDANRIYLDKIRVLNTVRRQSSLYFFADSEPVTLDMPNISYMVIKGVPNYETFKMTFELIEANPWEITLRDDEIILMYYDTGFWYSIYPAIEGAINKARDFQLYRAFRFTQDTEFKVSSTSITIPAIRTITMNRFYESGAETILATDNAKNQYITATLGTPNTANSLTINIHDGFLKGEDSVFNISTYGRYDILLGYKSAGGRWCFTVPILQSALDNYYINNGELKNVTMGRALNGGDNFAVQHGIGYNSQTESPENGNIIKLEFFALSAGVIKFGIGIVDQWSKAIIERTFELTAVNGYNTFNINERILKGQILFGYINGRIAWNAGGPDAPRMVYNDEDVNGELKPLPVPGTMSLKYTIETITPNLKTLSAEIIETKAQMGAIKAQVDFNANNIYTTDTVTGVRYKIVVENGALYPREVKNRKVTAFGNSMTYHEITPFWWGAWGMAATNRPKDWVHQLQTILRTKDPLAEVTAFNIAEWEVNLSNYNYSLLDQYLGTDVDAVILRLGENGPTAGYASEFNVLIEYIKSKAPYAQIIIGGLFWQNDTKETAMKSSASTYGLPFVDFSYMWGLPQYRQTVNTQVFGDDGVWHTISDGGTIAQGVADHPNDEAFLLWAQAFAQSLGAV